MRKILFFALAATAQMWGASCTSINAKCIQSVYATQGSGLSLAVTISAPASTNSLYVVFGGGVTQSVTSITGGGVTWNGSATIRSATNRDEEIWCGSLSSGSGTTVTINVSQNAASFATVVELAGTTCTADKTGSATTASTTGASFSGGTVTSTTNSADAILAGMRYNGANSASISTFSALQQGTGAANYAAIYFPGATGTYTPTWTGISNGAPAESTTVAFLPKASGIPPAVY